MLIGDAAGHNDPIIGQGASIALRDARIVRDIVLAGDLRPDAFQPYVEERLERMRRLRIAAKFTTTLRAEFGPEAAARRARTLRRIFVEGRPSLLAATMAGPDALPAEVFEQKAIDALLAVD